MTKEWSEVINKILKIATAEAGIQITEKNFLMIETRLKKRLLFLNMNNPKDYLKYLEKNISLEKKAIISLLTTHYTSFFREYFHFEEIENIYINKIISEKKDKIIRIWSSACSQGQEPYSLSMLFYRLKQRNLLVDFDYNITATDIDIESVDFAKNGVYKYKEISQIPIAYIHGNWAKGSQEIKDFVRPQKHIKDPITFAQANLLNLEDKFNNQKFDIIFCRNVLIYYKKEQVIQIIKSLLERLEPHGILALGISESILGFGLPIKLLSNSIYIHDSYTVKTEIYHNIKVSDKRLIRVLCIDDSPTILSLLDKILTKERGFQVIAKANSIKEARKFLEKNEVDVVTLDIFMPEETGIDYLKKDFKKNSHPPIMIISSLERDGKEIAKQALDLGASDYVEKPDLKNIQESSDEICFKLETLFKNKKNFNQ